MRCQLIALAFLFACLLACPIQFLNAQEPTNDFLLEEAAIPPGTIPPVLIEPGGDPVDPVDPEPMIGCSVTNTTHAFNDARGCYVVPEGKLFSATVELQKSPLSPAVDLACALNFQGADISLDGKSLAPRSDADPIYDFSVSTEVTTLMISWMLADISPNPSQVTIQGNGDIGVLSGCSFSVCSDTATSMEPPICDLRVTSTFPHQCTGDNVEIALSASESSTTIPGGLSYAYSTTCSNGTIIDGINPTNALLTISPSTGEECSVTTTVTDILNQSSTCAVEFSVPNCDSPDTCPSEVDICGVCGGNGSSCLTCETLDVTPIQMTSELHLRSAAERLRTFFLQIGQQYKNRNMLRSHLAGMLERKVNRVNNREAAALQVIWMPPSLISLCTGPQINTCSVERYDETVELFRAKIQRIRRSLRYNSRSFFKRRLYSLLREKGRSPEQARLRSTQHVLKLRRAVRADLKQAREAFNEIPAENFSCEGLTSSST